VESRVDARKMIIRELAERSRLPIQISRGIIGAVLNSLCQVARRYIGGTVQICNGPGDL
jgi:hypothetical protein